MSNWQPIETAPERKRILFLGHEEWNHRKIVVGEWFGRYVKTDASNALVNWYSHWHELPEPPHD